jgi:hypothetical protein
LDAADLRDDLAPAAINAPANVGPPELALAESTPAPAAAIAAFVVPAAPTGPDGLTLAATDTWIMGAAFMAIESASGVPSSRFCHSLVTTAVLGLRGRPPTGRDVYALGIRIKNDVRFAAFELTDHSFDLLIERDFLFTVVGPLAQHERLDDGS